jgi:hypothetical protein
VASGHEIESRVPLLAVEVIDVRDQDPPPSVVFSIVE